MKKYFLITVAILLLIAITGLMNLWGEEVPQMIPNMAEDCLDGWEEATGQDLHKHISFIHKASAIGIGNSYTFPNWYYKRIEFENASDVKVGQEFTVNAWLMPWMTTIKDVEVGFSSNDGLQIAGGDISWEGDIQRCEVKGWNFKVLWKEKKEGMQRVQMGFSYDFPRGALLKYAQEDPDMKYGNPALKSDFIDWIKEYPDDRKYDSIDILVR